MSSVMQEFTKGLWKDLPPFRLVLGLCPTLAVTNSANNGLGMGAAVIFVLVLSNMIISMVRGIIPKKVRIACFIVIAASLVVAVELLMQAYAYPLYQQLGIFVPLIVVNCIILARAEAFAAKNGVAASVADGLGIGLGYTIYLGSEYESTMLAEAGQLIAEAHAAGLLVVLWIYPRGKAVADEKAPALIAGAAGVALCLGADFVKVNPPKATDEATSAENLAVASAAAGRTGLVCAGGSTVDAETFLTQLHDQIHIGHACGNATGRNIHQRSLDEAVRLTKAISAITLADYSVADALAVFKGEKDFAL